MEEGWTRRRVSLITLLAVISLSAVSFTPVSKSAVTIGSDLSHDTNITITCTNAELSCTDWQTTLPGHATRAPSNGVVVRWRVRRSGLGGSMRIRIVRFAGGTNYSSAGISTQVTPTDGVSTYNTRLPILATDYVGLDRMDAGSSGDVFYNGFLGAEYTEWSPSIADGSTATTFSYPFNQELLVNADIEADADGDGYGDETQDQCLTDATTQGPCPAVVPQPQPQLDTTAPKQTIQIKEKQRLSKLRLTDTLDEDAVVTVSAKVQKKKKKKILGRSEATTSSVTANVEKALKVKFSKKTLKKLKKYMRKQRKSKLIATVTVSAVDQSGNTNTVEKQVSLKR